MTATDTEIAFIGDLAANVTTGGELAVDAAGLFQVIRSLPEATVHLKQVDNNRLEVRSGRALFKLLGLAAEEYPTLPPFEATGTARLKEKDLLRVVDRVAFAVAKEDVRWGLNGAHVEEQVIEQERRLRLVATDRHRLAGADVPFEGDYAFTPRMLIPRKALGVIKKLLDSRDEEIELDFGDGALQLRQPSHTVWFRLLDGDFPDYNAAVPKEGKHRASIRRSELAATLRRVGILVTDRTRPVRFSFSDGELEVQVQDVDRGEVRETLPIELDGGDIAVGFNGRYLQDILSVMTGERVLIELAHPLAASLIRDPDDSSCFFVVMPMRLS
jgi:DNA polymerase-3 subunit beta